MNETEFETRIASILRNLFPTISPVEITQQKSFKIKFGHHNVLIDGKDPGNYAKRSVYDILIKYQNNPIAILELKRPGLKLTADDIDQGVSYARLTDPITPLTIISNGQETIIVNTYNKSRYDAKNLGTKQINDLFRHGLETAATEVQNTIAFIVKNDYRIMSDVINTISDQAFKQKHGSCDELDKPIVQGLRIDRELSESFQPLMEKQTSLYLVGDRYCGKTNFLYQLYLSERKNGNAFLYVDCNEPNYSIFKRLSSFLTNEIKYFITEEKIKQWLLTEFDSKSGGRLTFCYDHFQYNTKDSTKEEIIEIAEIIKGKKNRLLLSSDINNYTALCDVEGSETKTFFKNSFKKVRLKYFTQNEYQIINHLLIENFGSMIMLGGEYSGAYRNPRIWRWLALDAMDERPDESSIGLIKAVPTIELLSLISKRLVVNDQTLVDFKKVTNAYLKTLLNKTLSRDMQLMAQNLPILTDEAINQALDLVSINRLLNFSLLERRLTLEHEWVYVIKLPELLVNFAVEPLKASFLKALKENFERGYSLMISVCEYLPYGEIIAAKIISDYCFGGEDILVYKVFEKLQSDKPIHEYYKGAAELRLFLPEGGFRDITTKEEDEQHSIQNNFPYLILSHLVGYSFHTSEEDPHATHKKCIALLGLERHQLRSMHIDTFFELQPPTLLVENAGDLIAGDVGITEPFVQAVQAVLLECPHIILKMIEPIVRHRKFTLLHRIYVAAKYTHKLVRPAGPNPCLIIMKSYYENIHKMLAHATAPKGATKEDIRRLEKDMKKRNTHARLIANLV
jgi:hypothetical protein